jgi:hypothetical protein
MIVALLSFLGGGVGRMIFGEIVAYLNKKQDHQQELDRLQFQAELEKAQHARTLESMQLQATLGIKVIEAQAEAKISELETEGWLEAVKGTTKQVGIAWVDAWNAVIRPGVATWAIVMMTLTEFDLITMNDSTEAICGAALGIYLAARDLAKRGK